MAVILTVASREHPEITFTTPIYYIYVIAADAPLPELTLEAPFSAQVDQAVVYQLAEELNLDDFDYTLDFGDGETAVVIDSSVSHTYHATGIFQAVLTAVSLRDGTTYRQTFNITIVPYPVPNVGIDGPTHAVFRTPVALNVIDPTPGTTYTWNCGNGGPAITGTSATCTYMETGRVQVILTGDNHGTINTSFHFISIHE
jgi:PKD repeat protein